MPELQPYECNLPGWLAAHEGELGVRKGYTMAHFAQSCEDVLSGANETFGLTGFFVKRVATDAAAVHLSRNIGLARARPSTSFTDSADPHDGCDPHVMATAFFRPYPGLSRVFGRPCRT